MKTIKPKLAYAVVNKKNPKICVNDVYATRDVMINDDEQIIKVHIIQVK